LAEDDFLFASLADHLGVPCTTTLAGYYGKLITLATQ
jgi:hypothetical protein